MVRIAPALARMRRRRNRMLLRQHAQRRSAGGVVGREELGRGGRFGPHDVTAAAVVRTRKAAVECAVAMHPGDRRVAQLLHRAVVERRLRRECADVRQEVDVGVVATRRRLRQTTSERARIDALDTERGSVSERVRKERSP